MATATAFGLTVRHEDTMDMSSPLRQDDGDIDIDLEDDTSYLQDDQMIEDVDQRPSTATDAEMDDDLQSEMPVVHEEEMSDPVVAEDPVLDNAQDDELIDYDDDDYEQPDNTDAALVASEDFGATATRLDLANAGDAVQPTTVLQTEVSAVEASPNAPQQNLSEQAGEAETAEDPAPGEAAIQDRLLEAEAESTQHTEEDDASGDHATVSEPAAVQQYDDGNDPDDADQDEANQDQENQGEATEDQYNAGIDEYGAHSETNPEVELPVEADDAPATPTDTGLHPVVLYFHDQEMPLFKSKHHPDGLLKNDNLANLSLAELMQHCKERLAIRGEDVPEQKEAVLSFDHLALMLYETSRSAYECSLNDVLDTFLQLHRNDGVTDIPPMSLTLSLQLKFSSSLEFLRQLATTGHGIFDVPGYHPHATDEQDQHEHPHDETGDDEYHEERTEDTAENYEDHAAEYPEPPQDEYHFDEEDYHEDRLDAAGEAADEHNDPEEVGHEDEGHDREEDLNPPHPDTTNADLAGPTADDHSAASSVTLQDDPTTLHHRKSDDDLIDYTIDDDEHELTSDVSAATHDSAGNADRSTNGEYTGANYIDWDDLTPLEAEDFSYTKLGGDGSVDAHEPEDNSGEYDKNDYPSEQQEQEPETDRTQEDGEAYDVNYLDFPEEDFNEDGTEEFTTALDIQAETTGSAGQEESAAAFDAEPAVSTFTDAEVDVDELIDYDDDTTEEHNQKVAAAAEKNRANSPLGKRSFEEDDDLIFDEEPTPKKPRAV